MSCTNQGQLGSVSQWGQTINFIPHQKPVELAPRQNENYWVADLNAKIYERSLLNNPNPDPNAEYHARESLLATIGQANLRPNSDPYLQQIANPQDSFAHRVNTCKPLPAMTRI